MALVMPALLASACGDDSAETAGAGDSGKAGSGGSAVLDGSPWTGGSGGSAALDASADVAEDSAEGGDSDGGSDASTPGPEVSLIHDHHRFISGGMFGGWGPHLGHLVRAPASSGNGDSLWFVDDYCSQPGDSGATCDVLSNHTLGYFEKTSGGWQARGTVALPGSVQQNTATLAVGGELQTFGIDVVAHSVRECRFVPKVGPSPCTSLPFTLGPSTNYIGAAVSPQGSRLVWWTGVVDGGGGSFHYVVDYGGGWNGPRSGGVAGYNDASYINVAFGGAKPSALTFHAQLVAGKAPAWTFLGAVGYADLTTTDAVSWSNVLAPSAGDAISSTNDVWTDPDSGDTHLIARTAAGAVAYFHRPNAGAWATASFSMPSTYRARFVPSEGRLSLVYGPNAGELAHRVATKVDRPSGKAIAWSNLKENHVALPAGFGPVLAIYPESTAYQTTAVSGLNFALVGAGKENVVAHVSIAP